MKKKILCLFILSFIFILPNSIGARTCSETVTIRFSTVVPQGFSGIDEINNIVGYLGKHSYSSMELNGTKSMCVSKGAPAHNDDEYIYFGIAKDPNQIHGFAFYLYGAYDGSDNYKWLISQHVVWNGGSRDDILKILKLDPIINEKYDSEQLDDYAEKLWDAIQKSTGTFYIWKNKTTSDGQYVITTLESCDENNEIVEVCPLGTMVKNNPGMSCTTAKGGIKFDGFTYLPTSGNKTSVHTKLGEEKDIVGKYCRVYCTETGSATLPGAFGEKLQLGSYMIWPTSSSNSNSKFYEEAYPLKFEGTLTCKIGILPDKDMPLSCKDDPVGDYSDLYNEIEDFHDTPTYLRKAVVGTLEKMRKKITTKVTEAPDFNTYKGWCTSAYNNENWVNGKEYTYNGAINERTKAAKKVTEVSNEISKLDDSEKYKWEQHLDREPERVNTDRYNALLKKLDSATTEFNNKDAIVRSIETGIKTCANYITTFETARQILLAYKQCAEYDASESLYNFSSSVSFYYKDKQYEVSGIKTEGISSNSGGEMLGNKSLIGDEVETVGFTFDDLKKKYKQEKKDEGSLSNIVGAIEDREFSITKSETYTLNTGYSYLDKDKSEYKKNNSGLSNYILLNNIVIPSSYKNEIGKKYELKLYNISFGMAPFGQNVEGNNATYICPVEFTNSRTPDTCVCPEGTANEGKDLTCLIENNNNNMTCLDAQVQYCEATTSQDEIPENCGGNLYCPYPNDNISIGSCINSGKTYNWCVQNYCPGADNIKCPDKYGSTASNMDEQLRDCVQVKMAQGLDKTTAINICEPLVCPGTRRIIYRTIKLENPFPSYDADTNTDIIPESLKVRMFNNDVRGRYPGSNWNGILTVYNKIRNNRGTPTKDTTKATGTTTELVGTTIYQKKKPLYTFVLNGATIKEIRDYNDKQDKGYNDFNLDCQINNSTACVSSFVHNSIYGLVSGECKGNTRKSNFYTCARR